jgi:hypothetical protein
VARRRETDRASDQHRRLASPALHYERDQHAELFKSMHGLSNQELETLSSRAPAGADGLVFLPFIDGERVPVLPASPGVLFGLDKRTFNAAHLRAHDGRLFSTFDSNEFQEEYLKFLDLKITDYDDYVKTYGLKGLFKIFPFFVYTI